MISKSAVLLIVIVIISVIIIAVGIGWIIRNNQQTPPPVSEGYTHPLVWTSPVPGTNPFKNTCKLYQFPTTMPYGITGTAFIGAPTYNANTLNGMVGITFGNDLTCLDVDQIIAQQLQHSCTGPLGVVDNSLAKCVTLDGTILSVEETETYYSNVLCENKSQCAGQLSLVSLNYHGLATDLFCLNRNYPNFPDYLVVAPCNPSNEDQIFRVTRTSPGTNPDTLKPGSQNGILAQIYDRDTDTCLVPGITGVNVDYNPLYVFNINGNCTGEFVPYKGLTVTMGACTGGPYPGYVWVLMPSIQYCGITAGCSGCATGYNRAPNSNECCDIKDSTSCPGTAGYQSMSTPQQIFYIGDSDFDSLPATATANDLFEWAIDNKVPRLFFGGEISWTNHDKYGIPTLSPLTIMPSEISGVDSNMCGGISSVGQYLNLTLYNTLIQEQPCIVEEISESYCLF